MVMTRNTYMGELNLEIISPELADIVLDVAEECDQRYCDRMKFKIPPIKIKIVIDEHEFEISNAEELEATVYKGYKQD